MTDWTPISPLLNNATLSSYLPTIPTLIQASSIYPPDFEFSNGAPFATFTLTDFPNTALLCPEESPASSRDIFLADTVESFAAARAGPSDICDPSTCRGLPQNSVQCRAVFGTESIKLRNKLGTYWAKALGTPAWAQFTFPAVVEGSDEVHFRFELDSRYRPELYGGNACDNGSDEYECVLCRDYEVWDTNVPAGVHVLWTAAGRDEFVIDGPYDGLGEAWDARDLVRRLDVPEGMAYEVGEYPVVTLMTFSQYPAYGEVSDISKCSVDYSNEGNHTYKDNALMISEVSLMYRTQLNLTKTPPANHPRLYGTDAEWMAEHITPFISASCDPDTGANVGWFEDKGYWGIKTHFDFAARGYSPCDGRSAWDDIGEWFYLEDYFKEVGEDNSLGYPKARGGFKAFDTSSDGRGLVTMELRTTVWTVLGASTIPRRQTVSQRRWPNGR